MSAADRVDKVTRTLTHYDAADNTYRVLSGGHDGQDDITVGDLRDLVTAVQAALDLADEWDANPAVGYDSQEQWELDTLRNAARHLRTAIEEALR